ncbi:nephrocystin-4 [Ditylenchus destructor]|uniref:Nephrocystin-4 n=1 Tax=Ditylenchus destructor TaxID=166010 RepID=A0AAD4RA57_9BILA|nr:nephrocystin-4 [Ditylenchus destructor]
MGSPAIWYRKFLHDLIIDFQENLSVPPPPSLVSQVRLEESTFYTFTAISADFKELEPGNYVIHCFFFDEKERKFFGRMFRSQVFASRNSSLRLSTVMCFLIGNVQGPAVICVDPAVHFHTRLKEERVLLVCEIVRLGSYPRVIGWAVIPVYQQNRPISDVETSLPEARMDRYTIYSGSCRALLFAGGLADVASKVKKLDAILIGQMQTNQPWSIAVSFMPDYFITSFTGEYEIPGIVIQDGQPRFCDISSAIIDNISVSFGADYDKVETSLLNILIRDHCYKLNKSPADKNFASNLIVIERKLRVGIHNGLTYIEEPICLYLSSKNEGESGMSSFRRRSRSLSRSAVSNDAWIETAHLIVRNSTKLTRLCADPAFAIIFAIDYLVGFRRSENMISDTQLIMVAWGAWSPYQQNAFTIADSVTVPLVGGPRPNPDEIFCLTNLSRIRDSNFLADLRPQFTLRFNFAIVDSTNPDALLRIPANRSALSGGSRTTPLPKPDIIAPSHEQVPSIVEDIPPKLQPRKESVDIPVEEVLSEEDDIILPPKSYAPDALSKSRSLPSLAEDISYKQRELITEEQLPRVSAFPRAISSYLSKFDFPKIVDRHGSAPTFIKISTTSRPVNIKDEMRSRLDGNEIILQFMAITILPNPYYTAHDRSSRYFFTYVPYLIPYDNIDNQIFSLKFYRFPEVTTERLLAQRDSEWKSRIEPFVLRRIDDDDQILTQDSTGFAIKYVCDKASISPACPSDLIEYLAMNRLSVDVWDADSLIHVGSVAVPLRSLCRQNMEAVETEVQCGILQNSLPGEPFVTGLLFLKMANIGFPSVMRKFQLYNTNPAAKRFSRICRPEDSTNHGFHNRARPLGEIHDSALQRFLATQKLDLHQRKEEIFDSGNMLRLQQWNEVKRNMAMPADGSVKKFIFHEELEAYKNIRNQGKAAILLKAVFKGITTHYTVYAEYGRVEFFEFLLRNTFTDRVICLIDIGDPRLCLVTNVDEWKFFKDMHNLKTPLERDLFNFEEKKENSATMLLNGMESVYIPFKYDPHQVNVSKPSEEWQSFEITVVFKRMETNEPISILKVTIENRNFCLTSSHRLFHEERKKVSKLIRIQGIKDNKRVLALRSSDPTVLCSLRNRAGGGHQDVLVTCYTDNVDTDKSFLVLLYGDRFYSVLLAVWSFTIHSVHRMNVEAIQAQTTKIPLLIQPFLANDLLLRLHSSSNQINFFPNQPFISNQQSLSDIQALLHPNFSGSRIFTVTLVDANLMRLVSCWLINAIVGEPNIVKTYEITISLAEAREHVIQKRIVLENPYTIWRKFRVQTSNDKLVSVDNEYYSLEGKESVPIQLSFHPINLSKATSVQVLVFVENAETAQQEEAYSINILYTT